MRQFRTSHFKIQVSPILYLKYIKVLKLNKKSANSRWAEYSSRVNVSKVRKTDLQKREKLLIRIDFPLGSLLATCEYIKGQFWENRTDTSVQVWHNAEETTKSQCSPYQKWALQQDLTQKASNARWQDDTQAQCPTQEHDHSGAVNGWRTMW